MSSLKDLQYAMYGEQTQKVKPQEEYIPKATTPKSNLPTTEKHVTFKLVNSNRKGGIHLPCVDYVIDERTVSKEKPQGNGPEMVRVLSGVSTIWVKEQEKLTPEYVKKNLRVISWAKGSRFLSIPTWDTALIDFMRKCRHNIQSPGRTGGSKFEFFEYNPEEAAKFRMKKELEEITAIRAASDMPVDKMEKHALFLGIPVVDEMGIKKGPESLRLDYILSAKHNPGRFNETVNSKTVEIQYKIRKAISEGKIDTGRQSGKIFWGKDGNLICSYPATDKPLHFLTTLAELPNDEGKQFLDQLNQIST